MEVKRTTSSTGLPTYDSKYGRVVQVNEEQITELASDWGISKEAFRELGDAIMVRKRRLVELRESLEPIGNERRLLATFLKSADEVPFVEKRSLSMDPKIQQAQEDVEMLGGEVERCGQAVKDALIKKEKASAAFTAANNERYRTPELTSKRKTVLNTTLPGLRSASSSANDVHRQAVEKLGATETALSKAKFRLSQLQDQRKKLEEQEATQSKPMDKTLLRSKLQAAKERYEALNALIGKTQEELDAYIEGFIQDNIDPGHEHIELIRLTLQRQKF